MFFNIRWIIKNNSHTHTQSASRSSNEKNIMSNERYIDRSVTELTEKYLIASCKLVTKSLSGLTNRFIKSRTSRPCIVEEIEGEGRMLAEKAQYGSVINA